MYSNFLECSIGGGGGGVFYVKFILYLIQSMICPLNLYFIQSMLNQFNLYFIQSMLNQFNLYFIRSMLNQFNLYVIVCKRVFETLTAYWRHLLAKYV